MEVGRDMVVRDMVAQAMAAQVKAIPLAGVGGDAVVVVGVEAAAGTTDALGGSEARVLGAAKGESGTWFVDGEACAAAGAMGG